MTLISQSINRFRWDVDRRKLPPPQAIASWLFIIAQR